MTVHGEPSNDLHNKKSAKCSIHEQPYHEKHALKFEKFYRNYFIKKKEKI